MKGRKHGLLACAVAALKHGKLRRQTGEVLVLLAGPLVVNVVVDDYGFKLCVT